MKPRAILLAALIFGGGSALAQDGEAACQVVDSAGGLNELVFEMRQDRIHAFRYRRSAGHPQCEVAASRAPSEFAWERFDWADDADGTDVLIVSDNIHQDAHVRITRRGELIELRVLSYNRRWLCGMGQYLHPAIILQRGQETCTLPP